MPLGFAKAGLYGSAASLGNFNELTLADLPIAFFKMDESSGMIQDSSGYDIHATSALGSGSFTYSITPPSGMAGAISFPGTKSFLCPDVWDDVSDFDNSRPFTVEVVARNRDWAGGTIFMQKGNSTVGNQQGFWCGNVLETTAVTGPSVVGFNSGWQRAWDTTLTLSNNVWYHIVYVVQASGAEIYVNNTSITISDNITADFNAGGTHPLAIGSSGDVGSWWLDGDLAHLAVYRTALSAGRIATKFAATGI